MAFEILPNALYSRSDLEHELKPLGIDVDGWLSRIKPVRRFRSAYWGNDLIRAVNEAPAIDLSRGGVGKPGHDLPNPKQHGKRVHTTKQVKSVRLIGGHFTLDELGVKDRA